MCPLPWEVLKDSDERREKSHRWKLSRYTKGSHCQQGACQEKERVSAEHVWSRAERAQYNKRGTGKGLSQIGEITWPWALGRLLEAEFQECSKWETRRLLAEGATQTINKSIESGKSPLSSWKRCVAVTRAAWEWKLPRETLEAHEKGFISPAYNLVFFKPVLPKMNVLLHHLGISLSCRF